MMTYAETNAACTALFQKAIESIDEQAFYEMNRDRLTQILVQWIHENTSEFDAIRVAAKSNVYAQGYIAQIKETLDILDKAYTLDNYNAIMSSALKLANEHMDIDQLYQAIGIYSDIEKCYELARGEFATQH